MTPTTPSRTIAFSNGDLRLRALLWEHDDNRRRPLVVWNHGSLGPYRGLLEPPGQGSTLAAWLSLGVSLCAPVRRGYDGSDGAELSAALHLRSDGVASNIDDRLVLQRLQAEAEDVLAAVRVMRDLPEVDEERIICSGYSFGAILTLLCMAREVDLFAGGVAFALAAILWPQSELLQETLRQTAAKVRNPLMLVQAQNDFSVDAPEALAATLKSSGVRAVVKNFGPFGSTPEEAHLFCTLGSSQWLPSVREFLSSLGI